MGTKPENYRKYFCLRKPKYKNEKPNPIYIPPHIAKRQKHGRRR